MSTWETLLRAGTGERDASGGGWLWAGSRQLDLPPAPYLDTRMSLAPLVVAAVVALVVAIGHGCVLEGEQPTRRSESVVP